MKKANLILLGLLLISNIVFGQDTITTNERYLIGTSILKGSNRNTKSCLSHGYCFDKIIKHPCSSIMSETPSISIIKSVTRQNDSLIISLQIYENCALDFLSEIEIINKNTLNIILHEYGSFASCMCIYDIDCVILIEKENVQNPIEIEYIILDNKKYTKLKIEK
mgnify:CR=1 FL=1